MAASSLFLLALVAFPIFALSSSLNQTVTDAIDLLSRSGYYSMALTLQLTSGILLSNYSSATIFSPSDDAFVSSGQPSLSVLRFHISPVRLAPKDLFSLPTGSKIPTLLQDHSLIVTSPGLDGQIKINNVSINGSAVYDDGTLAVYGTGYFFNPSSDFSSFLPDLDCSPLNAAAGDSFSAAADFLKSRGFSVMASFLALQFLRLQDRTKFTVFAPEDAAFSRSWGNLSEYVPVLMKHVVPCRHTWSDLAQLDDGSLLQTFSEGFTINVTRSGDILVLNGFPVIFPDMYYGKLLVIHGLRQVISSGFHSSRLGCPCRMGRDSAVHNGQDLENFGE